MKGSLLCLLPLLEFLYWELVEEDGAGVIRQKATVTWIGCWKLKVHMDLNKGLFTAKHTTWFTDYEYWGKRSNRWCLRMVPRNRFPSALGPLTNALPRERLESWPMLPRFYLPTKDMGFKNHLLGLPQQFSGQDFQYRGHGFNPWLGS